MSSFYCTVTYTQHAGRQYDHATDHPMAGQPHPGPCGHHQRPGKGQDLFSLQTIQFMEAGKIDKKYNIAITV